MRHVQYRWQGFTLMELLIVIAIMSILASLVYPAYLSSMMKSRRADATLALLKLQMDQEKYRANNPTYAASVTAADGLNWPSNLTENGYYKIDIAPSIAPNNAVNFTATATAVPGKSQENDAFCITIVIDQDGSAGDPTCW